MGQFSMIDISDGLATDLGHILERSKAGAEISAEKIPMSDASRAMKDQRTPLEHALFDGEDFELLFTVSSEKQRMFESSWEDVFELPCTAIGRITDRPGRIVLVDAAGKKKAFRGGGYEHFSDKNIRQDLQD